jgi:hypothetical protein
MDDIQKEERKLYIKEKKKKVSFCNDTQYQDSTQLAFKREKRYEFFCMVKSSQNEVEMEVRTFNLDASYFRSALLNLSTLRIFSFFLICHVLTEMRIFFQNFPSACCLLLNKL